MTEATATNKKAAPVIKTVTMTDGRVVEFAGKRRMLKESIEAADGNLQVRLDFVNGETRLFTITPEFLGKFALHGAEQKLGDEIAGLEDTDDAVMAVDALIDRLYDGKWTQARESNGMAGASVLVQALLEVYPSKNIEQIKAFLGGKSQAEKVAMRANPKIKPIVERIEAAKAAKKASVDTDALLGELDDAATASSPA